MLCNIEIPTSESAKPSPLQRLERDTKLTFEVLQLRDMWIFDIVTSTILQRYYAPCGTGFRILGIRVSDRPHATGMPPSPFPNPPPSLPPPRGADGGENLGVSAQSSSEHHFRVQVFSNFGIVAVAVAHWKTFRNLPSTSFVLGI